MPLKWAWLLLVCVLQLFYGIIQSFKKRLNSRSILDKYPYFTGVSESKVKLALYDDR